MEDKRGPSQEQIEFHGPAAMAHDILRFVDACPDFLFNAPHSADDDGVGSAFDSFLLCVASPRDEIRRRASGVAKRLFMQPSTPEEMRARKKRVSPLLKEEFWKRRFALTALYPSPP